MEYVLASNLRRALENAELRPTRWRLAARIIDLMREAVITADLDQLLADRRFEARSRVARGCAVWPKVFIISAA